MFFIGIITNQKNELYIRNALSNFLQEENIIVREGNNRKGRWVIKNDNEHEHHKTNH